MSMTTVKQQKAFILAAVEGVMDEGGVNLIVISNKAFPKLLKNALFTAKWESIDPNFTESVAHTKLTEFIIEWCAIHIYRIDLYNELRKVLVERNLFDGFLTTVPWEAKWERLPLERRLPLVVQGKSLFFQPAQMPSVKIILDSMEKYIVDSTPVLAPEPELEPEVEPVERVQTVDVAELPAEKALEKALEEVKTLKVELRDTHQKLHAVKHDFHEAKRMFFDLKKLCEQKDIVYEEQATRNEELIEKALEQAKSFAALHEVYVEAQDGVEKPWYDGDDDYDAPEGFDSVIRFAYAECEWVDGDAGDISVSSSDPSDSEEDTDEKMLAEPVERWTGEDEKNLAELKALNSGAIAVDTDILDAMIEKKKRCEQ